MRYSATQKKKKINWSEERGREKIGKGKRNEIEC